MNTFLAKRTANTKALRQGKSCSGRPGCLEYSEQGWMNRIQGRELEARSCKGFADDSQNLDLMVSALKGSKRYLELGRMVCFPFLKVILSAGMTDGGNLS